MSGGNCCWLTFLLPGLAQLLPLGYHRIVNSFGCKGVRRFLNLASIILNLFREQGNSIYTLLLSVSSGGDFRQLSERSRLEFNHGPGRGGGWQAGYLICRQLKDCPSIPRNSTRRTSHPGLACFSNVTSSFICADDL